VCQVCFSREFSALVNDCLGVGPISDLTYKTMDAQDVSDFETFVLLQIEVDIEAIQPWVLLCEHALVEQHKRKGCSSVKAKVIVPFRKF